MSINRNLSFLAEGASSSGVLSVTKGGTGLTTLTAGYIPYGNGTSALSSSSNLQFDGSNLGLGVTPPSLSTNPSLFIGGNQGLFGTSGVQVGFGTNIYNNAGTWKYVSTAAATLYQPSSGTHVWYYAASGTAGTSVSFTQAMTLDASGNLGIGNTPSGTYKLEVSGLVSDTAGNLRSLPLNSQTAAYIVAASDNGKVISITTGGVTINNSIMSAGMVVTIYNNSGSSQTITQGTGVTLQWAGQSSSTTGNRTLGLYGMATVYFLSASSAVITGSGLT